MLPVGRIYDTEQQARAAAQKLQDEGIAPERVALFVSAPDANADAVEQAVPNLPPGHAIVYGRALQNGQSVVVVQTYFGRGESWSSILNSFNPVDTQDLPLVRTRSASPFSDLFGMPTLARSRDTLMTRIFPALSSPDFAFSSKFGMKLLSSNPAPLSSMLKLGLLSSNPAPLSNMFKLKLLSSRKS
jgi:hypothetical protein